MPTPAECREMLRQFDELTDAVQWQASGVQGRTSVQSAPRAPSWPRDAGNVRQERPHALVARWSESVLVMGQEVTWRWPSISA